MKDRILFTLVTNTANKVGTTYCNRGVGGVKQPIDTSTMAAVCIRNSLRIHNTSKNDNSKNARGLLHVCY